MSDPYPTRSPMINEGGGLDVRSYIELTAKNQKDSLETATRTLDYKVEASTKALDEKTQATVVALDEKMEAVVLALDAKTTADNERLDQKLELIVTNIRESTKEHAKSHQQEHFLVEKALEAAKLVNDEWRHDANQWRDTLTVYMNSVPSKSDLVNVTEKIERAESSGRQEIARAEQLLKAQLEATNSATANYRERLEHQLAEFSTWRANMEGQRIVVVAVPTVIATLVGILAIINFINT